MCYMVEVWFNTGQSSFDNGEWIWCHIEPYLHLCLLQIQYKKGKLWLTQYKLKSIETI